MSTTIDQKVVEMRFDNKHFESNVSTTMSTLDKLKQKLNLTGASKGLDNISASAKKVDMSGLASGVETVRARFSALDVMAVTALANITNSAVNAGKRIASALTIDPIKTGLSEYEIKMNAIQVIQANTRGKNDMNDITAALDDLNEYADKTIYNFAQMTSNIGKFTAQGFDVHKAANAVKGMANLAAASGASAEDMARATYQMSQALGGTIKLMDWNSLRNANMATVELKNTLIALAKVHGIAIDDMIAKEGTFEQTLSSGWLTGEMFSEAMNIYSGIYSDAELKAKGFTDSQIANFKDLAKMAESAATEVKTFTQLWDVLKETAQSGWTQTWELIFGDFEEAKSMFTNLQVYFSDIINGWSDARNTLLGGLMKPAETWNKIKEKLEGSGLGKIKDVAETVSNVTHSLEHFQEVVNDVWRGDYKNSDTGRYELLEKAGYDHRVVQDLVNKGYQYKLTMEDVEASHKKFGLTMDKTTESTNKAGEAFATVSDEKLRDAGLTEAEIRLYRQLEEESRKTGKSIQEIVDGMAKKDGRTMLIESIKNAWGGLVTILDAVRDAWVDIFPPITVFQLYKGIEAIHDFSKNLKVSEETADKIKRTFKGLFAAIDIVTTILGGGFKIAFKAITQLLGMFDLDILDVTANIGDMIVGFRDWIDSSLDFTKIFEFLVPLIKDGVEVTRDWFNAFKNSKVFKDIVLIFDTLGDKIRDFIVNFKDSDIGKNIVDGLVGGLKSGAKAVWDSACEIGLKIIEAVKGVLGIHSPSTVFFEIGKNIIDGLVNGIQFGLGFVIDVLKWLADACVSVFTGGMESLKGFGGDLKDIASGIWKFVSDIASKIGSFLGNIDFGTIVAGGLSGGILFMLIKIGKALDALASPLEGIGDILDNAADTVKAFTGVLKSFSMSIKAKALKDIAIALGILVAAIAVLCFLPAEGLDTAVKVIATLAIILAGLAFVMGKVGKVSEGLGSMVKGLANIAKISGLILSVSAAMLLMAGVVKIMAGVSWEEMGKAGVGILGFAGIIAGLVYITKFAGPGIQHAGKTIRKIAVAMLLLTLVGKIIATMSWDDIKKAGAGILGMAEIIGALIVMSSFAGKDIDKIGGTIFKIGAAMLLLTAVGKIIANMTWEEMGKAGVGILALSGIIVGLIAATKLLGPKDLKGLGATLLGIGAAMFLMTMVGKMIVGMSWEELGKAGVGIIALSGIIVGLVAATRLAGGNNLKGVASTLLAMSVAIGILAGVSMILGLMDEKALLKGIGAVSVLSIMMSLMVAATKNANNCKGNLIAMSIAIAAMTASVVVLSMLEPDKLAGATVAIGLLMGIFAVITKFAGTAKGSIGTLAIITIAVGMIGYILYQLAQLPVESTMGSAIALSALLLAVAVAVKILSTFSGTAGQALVGILALTAMAIPLLAFVGILALMQNISNAMANVKALSLLTGALTLCLIPLTIVGNFAIQALAGVLALTAMAIPMITFVGILALMEKLDHATENVKNLTIMMGAMTVLMVALALIGPMAMIGISALAGLMAVIVGVGLLAVGIGALMEKFPQLQEFLNSGIPVLEQIAHGIGSFVGNLVSGFADGLTNGLPEIGQRLTDFMNNAQGFIDGAKQIDKAAVEGVKSLVEAILMITGANLLESITSWITGGSSIAEFGSQLGQLGTDLSTFVTNLGTFDESKVATVNCAGKALVALAQAAEAIPNEGGWVAKIVGDNSIAAFGAKLPTLGSNLASFASNLGTFDEATVTTVKCAGNALKSLAQAADAIPNEGGWVAKIVGDNSIATFGAKLPALGTNLATFAKNLGTFDDSKVTTVSCAAKAIKTMAQAADTIPGEGNWLTKLFGGKGDISTFGSKLEGLGKNIAGFAKNLGTFGESKVTTVDCAVKAVKAVAALADADLSGANKVIGSFGNKLVGFGKDISSFCSKISGAEGMSGAISNVKKLIEAVEGITEGKVKTIADFSKALKKLGDNGIDSFVEAFTSAAAKTNVKTAAVELVNQAISGFESKEGALKRACNTLVSTAAGAIKSESNRNKFYKAGSYLVSGFAAGISENDYKAEAKARAMAKAAAQAAEDALDINSPSKVFRAIGYSVPEGFAMGIDKLGGMVTNSAVSMAENSVEGVRNAILNIASLINSDMDAQPTIRPVLDLTNVRSGANALNNMFDTPIATANVSAIGSMMARRNQNGVNSDVVSAIDKLRKELGNVGSVSYTINGVTYDDGSNVSDAIKTIVRHAKIERRV